MSSNPDVAATAAALVNNLYTGGYCQLATSALFIYDAFVMLDREVACFRTSKRRAGAAFLYYTNKGTNVITYVVVLVGFAPFLSDQVGKSIHGQNSKHHGLTSDIGSCSVLVNVHQALDVLRLVPGVVFSALRAYVLSRNRLLGILVLALSLAPVGANLVRYGYQLSGGHIPPFEGCLAGDSTTKAINLRQIILSRVPLIVADMLLIYITWTKLSSRDALRDLRQSKRLSLSDILFRDGTIYFVILFVLNILHLVFSLNALGVENSGTSYVTQFTSPLTAILVSRFLLDLQDASQAIVRVDRDDPLHTSRNPWDDTSSVISSLGAFIDPDRPVRSDPDMEWDLGSHLDGEEEGRAEVSELEAAAETSSPSAIASSPSSSAADPSPSSATEPSSRSAIVASSSFAGAASTTTVYLAPGTCLATQLPAVPYLTTVTPMPIIS